MSLLWGCPPHHSTVARPKLFQNYQCLGGGWDFGHFGRVVWAKIFCVQCKGPNSGICEGKGVNRDFRGKSGNFLRPETPQGDGFFGIFGKPEILDFLCSLFWGFGAGPTLWSGRPGNSAGVWVFSRKIAKNREFWPRPNLAIFIIINLANL